MSWDVRTNIKAKPGSQGTLFQGGSEQMTDAKWPRGYTPGRLAIARAAADPHGMYSRGEHDKSDNRFGTGPQRRDLIDTIARSTVPAEHLQDVKFYPGQNDLDYNRPKDSGSKFVTGGTYTRKGSQRGAMTYRENEISIRRGNEANSVPIHEIGHHVSHESGNHGGYDSSMERGKEEAFADDYASRHYRPKRGEFYGGQWEYAMGARDERRTDTFYSSYHASRQTPMPEREVLGRMDRRAQAETEHAYRNPPLPGLEKYHRPGAY